MGSDRENRNMRITEKQLRQIIREEVKSLRETDSRPKQRVVGDYVYEINPDGTPGKLLGPYDAEEADQYGEYLYPDKKTGRVPNFKSVPVGGRRRY